MTVLVLPNVPDAILAEWNIYAERSGLSLEQLVMLMTTLSVRGDRLNLSAFQNPPAPGSLNDTLVFPLSKSSKPVKTRSGSVSIPNPTNCTPTTSHPLPQATKDTVAAGTAVQLPEDWIAGPSAADLEDAIPPHV